MNYKTFFIFAFLAFSAIIANPIDEISNVKTICLSDRKSNFYTNELSGEYMCLTKVYNDIYLGGRPCYISDKFEVVCVLEGLSNIPCCSSSSGEYDYVECARKVINMIEEDGKIPYRIRKYISLEKLFNDYTVDQKECLGHDGIVLTNKEVFQYICLEPVTPQKVKSLKNELCAKIDGKYYYIYQDNTSVNVCNKGHQDYDYDICKPILKEFGTVNHHEIEIL